MAEICRSDFIMVLLTHRQSAYVYKRPAHRRYLLVPAHRRYLLVPANRQQVGKYNL